MNNRIEEKFLRELGPEVVNALRQEATEDVVLNPDGVLWKKSSGQGYVPIGNMDPDRAHGAICTAASMAGMVVNREHPILETEIGYWRFTGILFPASSAPVFAIRVKARIVYRLVDYVAAEALTASQASVLRSAIMLRMTVLVVGGTGSGKTTLLNALLAEVAELTPTDRLVLIEDTPELQCSAPNAVALRSIDGGEHRVSMLDCLRASLRLHPSRIIVGEVRGGEAHALLKAWNTGHPGGLATVHANDAAGGLRRLEALVSEAPEARGMAQGALIGEAVNVVVYIEAAANGAGRRVREIAQVCGWHDGHYALQPLFKG